MVYIPREGERVRVLAVCPEDPKPAHKVGDVFVAASGCEEAGGLGRHFAFVRDLRGGGGATWAIVEPAGEDIVIPAAPTRDEDRVVYMGESIGVAVVDACASAAMLPPSDGSSVPPIPLPPRMPSGCNAYDPPPATAAATPQARDSAARKRQPIATGVLAYFPRALAAVSEVSRRGNDKHNPGEPLHWAREKSTDEADACVRHIVDALAEGPESLDDAGNPNLAAAIWRALAWYERVLGGDERWRTVAQPREAGR